MMIERVVYKQLVVSVRYPTLDLRDLPETNYTGWKPSIRQTVLFVSI